MKNYDKIKKSITVAQWEILCSDLAQQLGLSTLRYNYIRKELKFNYFDIYEELLIDIIKIGI